METQRGWKICGEAETGQEAIEKTKELKPDVVILDVSMPVLNGFGAAKAIKEFSPETTILVYSAHGSEVFRDEARRIGVDGYISKSDGGQAILRFIDTLQRTGLGERPS